MEKQYIDPNSFGLEVINQRQNTVVGPKQGSQQTNMFTKNRINTQTSTKKVHNNHAQQQMAASGQAYGSGQIKTGSTSGQSKTIEIIPSSNLTTMDAHTSGTVQKTVVKTKRSDIAGNKTQTKIKKSNITEFYCI